jgi:hypothetical protein
MSAIMIVARRRRMSSSQYWGLQYLATSSSDYRPAVCPSSRAVRSIPEVGRRNARSSAARRGYPHSRRCTACRRLPSMARARV